MTAVMGAEGRSELAGFGGAASFLGFFAIFSLRWSPLAIPILQSYARKGRMPDGNRACVTAPVLWT